MLVIADLVCDSIGLFLIEKKTCSLWRKKKKKRRKICNLLGDSFKLSIPFGKIHTRLLLVKLTLFQCVIITHI